MFFLHIYICKRIFWDFCSLGDLSWVLPDFIKRLKLSIMVFQMSTVETECKAGMVAHAFKVCTQEAKATASLSLRPAWATQWGPVSRTSKNINWCIQLPTIVIYISLYTLLLSGIYMLMAPVTIPMFMVHVIIACFTVYKIPRKVFACLFGWFCFGFSFAFFLFVISCFLSKFSFQM